MRTALTPDDPRHGTTNGYSNLKCRCGPCRTAWSAAWLVGRAKRAQREPPENAHGYSTTYSNWGCRCASCKAAWAEYNRELCLRRSEEAPK